MTHSLPLRLEQALRPGWYMYWQDQPYRLLAVDLNALTLQVEHIPTLAGQTLSLEALLLDCPNLQAAPVFAPSWEALQTQIVRQTRPPAITPTADLPAALLARADRLIHCVQRVEHQVAAEWHQSEPDDRPFRRVEALQKALADLEPPLSLPTYYRYQQRYQRYHGDRGSIAASFRRITFNQSALSAAQLHFVDTLILRFYARQPPLRPSTLYKIASAALKRTGSLWLDPERCGTDIPQDLVVELLNPDLPMAALLSTPEKRRLLSPITLPSRSWLYRYLRWFERQPDRGQQLITARYGYATWEREQMVFDTFVRRAALPLQYVFADHWLLDVFTLDEATRSHPIRLWLTVLLDGFSRSVLGIALLNEAPCIESIQYALRHAIWPKTSHQALGLAGEWGCYGIPQQLSLDNAWAHHSHSLENLARVLAQGGVYPSIDLVFRPPYKGRYGALIERFFGNLSTRVKELLPGGIPAHQPGSLHQAAQQARLLYQDLYRLLHQFILVYQHTPHQELEGLTPHEKWQQGMAWGLACVPPRTPEMERLFWRLLPRARVITSKGIHVFGLTYWSPALADLPRVDRGGHPVPYSVRYDPADLGQVALFQDSHWLGDLAAKELRQPDGSLTALSVWERTWGKQLAREAGQADVDWLRFVQAIDALSQQRLQEKKRARHPTVSACPSLQAPHDESVLAAMESATLPQDYTALLACFMASQEDLT